MASPPSPSKLIRWRLIEPEVVLTPEEVRPLDQFWIWSRISISSFGGGTATLGLIRQELVSRRNWLTEEDFLREWSLCQLAPGINLIALVILISRRKGGVSAIAASLAGMLLPSFVVTVGLTALYTFFTHSQFVASARMGIIPAVAGIGLATAWSLLRPIGKRHFTTGAPPFLFYTLLLLVCFYGQRVKHVSPVLIVLGAGSCGAIFNLTQPKEKEKAE